MPAATKQSLLRNVCIHIVLERANTSHQPTVPFWGRDSKADTVFSNLTRGNGAPLCLMAQAVLSSSGQRALSMEKTWLFSLRAFFIPSNKPSHPFFHTSTTNTKDIQTEKQNVVDERMEKAKLYLENLRIPMSMWSGYSFNLRDIEYLVREIKQLKVKLLS